MTPQSQSARPDHRVDSASHRVTRHPTAFRLMAGAHSNSSSEQTSYLSVRLNRFGGRVLATRSVGQQRNTLGVTGWRDSQPNSAGYRMVRPEGFLDPEANVVRYHARRQVSPVTAIPRDDERAACASPQTQRRRQLSQGGARD